MNISAHQRLAVSSGTGSCFGPNCMLALGRLARRRRKPSSDACRPPLRAPCRPTQGAPCSPLQRPCQVRTCSPSRGARVVADTLNASASGAASCSLRMRLPLPTPGRVGQSAQCGWQARELRVRTAALAQRSSEQRALPQAPGGPPSPRRRPAASRPAHTAWWLPADPAGAPTARWAAIGGGGRAPRCPRAVPGPSPLGPTTTSALGGRFGASLAAASASAGAGVLCSAPIVLRAPLAARCLRRSSCGLCVCGLPSLRANPGGFDNDAQQRAAVPRARYRAAAARVPAAPDSRDRVRRRHSSCRAWARSSWPACTPP